MLICLVLLPKSWKLKNTPVICPDYNIDFTASFCFLKRLLQKLINLTLCKTYSTIKHRNMKAKRMTTMGRSFHKFNGFYIFC